MKFFILLLVSLTLFAPFAFAQQNSLDKKIADEIELLDKNTELLDEQKKQILTTLQDAQDILAEADEQTTLAKTFSEKATTAPQKILTIENESNSLKNKTITIAPDQSIDKLENQLLIDLAEQEKRLTALNEKQEEQSSFNVRASDIADELSTAIADKKSISDTGTKQLAPDASLDERADFYKKTATIEKLAETIKTLEREVATIPVREALVEAELTQMQIESEFYEKKIVALQNYLSKIRNVEVEDTLKQSQEMLSQFELTPALSVIAKENVSLAELLVNKQAESSSNNEKISALRSQKLDVKQSSETIDRVLATGRVTDELGELLRRLRMSLPNEGLIEKRKYNIEEGAVRNQLDVILWQETLRNTEEIEDAAKRFLAKAQKENQDDLVKEQSGIDIEFTTSEIEAAKKLVQARRQLLTLLIDVSNEQIDSFTEEKSLLNELLSSSTELRELLDRRLIWLPSNTEKPSELLINFVNNIDWYVSPSAWWKLINILYEGVLTAPTLVLLLLTLPITILALKPRIKSMLQSLVQQVGKVGKDTYLTTPFSLLLTFILALPLPIFLFTIAGIIFNNAESGNFSIAIATGLVSVSFVSLILLFFRSMCREDGVFDKHFDWSVLARRKLKKMLTWFVWVQSVVTFIFASAMASDEPDLRYGIAILAFIIGSVFIAIFSYQYFQPKRGVATSVEASTTASTLMLLSFPIVVISPFAIGLLPLFGFFDTAVELQSRLFLSGTLLVLASIVYGIMLRIFLVTFRRYIVKKKRLEALEAQLQQEESTTDDLIPQHTTNNDIDNDEVVRQSRAVILWVTRLLFIVCLWFVWKPILPALGIVEDIVLWQQLTVVDGVELSSGVTLWQVILGIAFMVSGVLAARNIRGVIEIGFFDRFEMDNGSRYAIVTILGYVLIGTGVVFGLSFLGINWSKLQWIVAALGVGLGFGLQEIVANFVSGIIILFERPIRVGDLVTIGDQSGTVTNIAIRATTLTDFDNREVLLPNKSIITENVTNWTLNDAITRVVIKIGVAYGSDVDQVQDLLMQVLTDEEDILAIPAPQVFFLEHGESSLNFEARVFVERTEHRLPITHAINTGFNRILAQHNISIPFPQRDLHIVSGQIGEPKET
ncbi:mechanosensitive ion channel domain-containing protein [uncultured Psychromonas sp.]|uniref:mechanosensitive ion channel domain-containing protein n=1 Tax=uncultured Psychromonas sp. TaxID=173974 RepID=UPI00260A4E95|nr:mechanosensitive ion channel domain-containing protein [uncultured Psychromonas sp.]